MRGKRHRTDVEEPGTAILPSGNGAKGRIMIRKWPPPSRATATAITEKPILKEHSKGYVYPRSLIYDFGTLAELLQKFNGACVLRYVSGAAFCVK